MTKQKLIIFEGVDRVGKTTLLNKLHSENRAVNIFGIGCSEFAWGSLQEAESSKNLGRNRHTLCFRSSAMVQLHLYNVIAHQSKSTILLDRWHISSEIYARYRNDYDDLFQNGYTFEQFVRDIEININELFDAHLVMLVTDYDDLVKLKQDDDWNLEERIELLADFHQSYRSSIIDNKHLLRLHVSDEGITDIEEQFNKLQIC